MTGLSSVTAAQLNQLVDLGTMATNKGAIIYGTATPDVASNPRYKSFLWLDSSTIPPTIKVYNTNVSTWGAQTLTAGSIGSNEIAGSSIFPWHITARAVYGTNIAIQTITGTNIQPGTILNLHLGLNVVSNANIAVQTISGGLGGAIAIQTIASTNLGAGSVLTLNLGPGVVTRDKIADDAVGSLQISNSAVDVAEIATNAVQSWHITNNAITGAHIQTNAIGLTNLSTNVATLLPRVFATTSATNGTVLRGSGLTCTKTDIGQFTFTFTQPPGFTNYCVFSTTMDDGGASADYGVSVSTNTATFFSVNVWIRASGNSVDPALLYVMALY